MAENETSGVITKTLGILESFLFLTETQKNSTKCIASLISTPSGKLEFYSIM